MANTSISANEKWVQKGLAILLGCTILFYVGFAFTPSHYGQALLHMGIQDKAPQWGEARAIRSDDWGIFTPYFQIAVLSKFAPIDKVSPYHETLKSFWALPIQDWSLIFKPQLWSFWILPPAYAYSIYFTFLWAGMIVGYTILLRQLKVGLLLSVAGAVALYSSHIVQVWWTTHAPAFAFAPWPLIVFLAPFRPTIKLPLLYWTLTFWLLAFLYPPFLISGAFALVVITLAFRRDMISVTNVVIAVIAVIAAAITVYFYFGDLFAVMKNTIYPGQRVLSGGGVPHSKLIAYVLPYFTTTQFIPFLPESNECEIAVVSTFVPLTFLCFVQCSSLVQYIRQNLWTVLIVGIGLAMVLAWLILPVPAAYGRVLLWSYVQPSRMVWGFGLLGVLSILVVASRVTFSFSWTRFWIFSNIIIATWLASKIGFTEIWWKGDMTAGAALEQSWFDWIALVPFAIAGLLLTFTPLAAKNHAPALFAAAAITGVITFGTFNPFQRAKIIFHTPTSALLEQAKADVRANPNGWAVEDRNGGIFGANLAGVGIPAINHVLMAPELKFFRRVFPDMPEVEFNQTFNRYACILPGPEDKLSIPSPGAVIVPIEPFTKRISSVRSNEQP